MAQNLPQKETEIETLIRIAGYDIPGEKNLYVGLTKIKGISWAISNGICLKLGISKSKKIKELTKDEIQKIANFIENVDLPNFLKNRRLDPESGQTMHYYGTDLEMKKEFDIKKQIKMKSHVGMRHTSGNPVRGQSTRSHFRSRANKRTTGIKRKTAVKDDTKAKGDKK